MAAVLIATTVLASACSHSGGSVAALDGSGGPATGTFSAGRQLIAAKAMRDCLEEAGLPVEFYELDGAGVVTWDLGKVDLVLFSSPSGGGYALPGQRPGIHDVPEGTWQRFEDQSRPGVYSVEIDGVDHSDTYNQCVSSTGYEEPAPDRTDPAAEIAQKQALAEVTNDWIKCARQNGFPGLADAEVPRADGFTTSPMALLPLTISEAELRGLIAACPVFNAERAQCALEPPEIGECEPNPLIGFVDPGAPDAALTPEQQTTAEALEAVLWDE
ncbi:MAG: hypothetical protein LBJ02_07520, partial [Bifidobacteriaceae bacterium]|nr:hypothetical protein [Bifidobacteriaceae bacterium]